MSDDFDGDGKTDPTVFRPSTGSWYVLKSSTNYTTSFGVPWGLSTDVPMPGDYDGDGITDIAVFRPSTGGWHILKSSTNYSSSFSASLGLSGDVPLPGDYDGDGKTDPAVYRSGAWIILQSNTGYAPLSLSLGLSTDTPVPADYDGDGRFDLAVFRPSTGGWSILESSSNYTTTLSASFGTGSDAPLANVIVANSIAALGLQNTDIRRTGDFDGDVTADITVFRPTNSTWYKYGVGPSVYGTIGDIPV